MPVSNRNYSMLRMKPIKSSMPMIFQRDDYDPPVKQLKRVTGTKVMDLVNLTPNNKAAITFMRHHHPKKIHKTNTIGPYKIVIARNITNNDIAGIKLVNNSMRKHSRKFF
jgi:hypothetical protein